MKKFLLSLLLLLISLQASSGEFIDRLIRNGELVLFHDYRSGTLYDWSNTKNDGVGQNILWQANGLMFTSSTSSKVTVTDNATLQGIEWTLVAIGDFTSSAVVNGENDLMVKRDAGGLQYYWYMDNNGGGRLILTTSGGAVTLNTTIAGSKYLATNYKNGETPQAFVDGAFVGNYSGAVTAVSDDANLILGNYYNAGLYFTETPVYGFLAINRRLTDTEHAQLYHELDSMKWNNKVTSVSSGLYGPELITDGDMELPNVTNWNGGAGAAVSKQWRTVLAGSRGLRVLDAVDYSYAYQSCGIVTGERLNISGWARGDGINSYPGVRTEGTIDHWAGTTSTAWQPFNIIVLSQGTRLELFSRDDGNSEFDNISVRRVYRDEIQWKSDWGAHASNVNATTGYLENTPFRIDSGTWKITTDRINGKIVKVIECVADGKMFLSAKLFRVSAELAGEGTWKWWLSKADASSIYITFVASSDVAAPNGWQFNISNGEILSLARKTGLSTQRLGSSVGYVSVDVWHEYIITRTAADVFTLYFDKMPAEGDQCGGCSNPFTDTALQTGVGIQLDFDAGDKIAWSDQTGDFAITKWHGDVRP